MAVPPTMREVLVHRDVTSTIHTVPVPTPTDNNLLIRVHSAAANPKDFKILLIDPNAQPFNTGDDLAGTVVAVGPKVRSFRPGDRVAALHVPFAPHGTYAEYALAVDHNTIHISETASFDEASTLPMAALTAAYALFREMGLREPWGKKREGDNKTLVVYGASSAVGAFAIKIARLVGGVGRIIGVAGKGVEFVKQKLAVEEVLDYRSATIIEELRGKLENEKDIVALDATGIDSSLQTLAEAVPVGTVVAAVSGPPYPKTKDGVSVRTTWLGDLNESTKFPGRGKEEVVFGRAVWAWLGDMFAEGILEGHPVKLVEGGLEAVGEGLRMLKDGKVSGAKVVFRLVEK